MRTTNARRPNRSSDGRRRRLRAPMSTDTAPSPKLVSTVTYSAPRRQGLGGCDPNSAPRAMSETRGELEAAVAATASSVDGRHFTFQCSLHGLAVESGGYVSIGEGVLGQVHTVDQDWVEGAEPAAAVPAEVGSASNVRIALARGRGVLLGGDVRPFHDVAFEPADTDAVERWLGEALPDRASLDVGELVLEPGVRFVSMREASTGTRSCVANPDRGRRTPSARCSSSFCSRRRFGSSSSTRTRTSSGSTRCATARRECGGEVSTRGCRCARPRWRAGRCGAAARALHRLRRRGAGCDPPPRPDSRPR